MVKCILKLIDNVKCYNYEWYVRAPRVYLLDKRFTPALPLVNPPLVPEHVQLAPFMQLQHNKA